MKDILSLVFPVSLVIVTIVMLIGWVLNVIKLFGYDYDPVGKEEIISIVGVFIPFVGGVYGWM